MAQAHRQSFGQGDHSGVLQRPGPDIEGGMRGSPLCAVLIISLGCAKLLVLLRRGASDGLPSFFKGVKRDQVGFICVGQIPPLSLFEAVREKLHQANQEGASETLLEEEISKSSTPASIPTWHAVRCRVVATGR